MGCSVESHKGSAISCLPSKYGPGVSAPGGATPEGGVDPPTPPLRPARFAYSSVLARGTCASGQDATELGQSSGRLVRQGLPLGTGRRRSGVARPPRSKRVLNEPKI